MEFIVSTFIYQYCLIIVQRNITHSKKPFTAKHTSLTSEGIRKYWVLCKLT